MSRSSDIVSQIQHRKAERKKPKVNAKLKKVNIDENQQIGISASRENKQQPMSVQKTGGRNSVSLVFSIVLHVSIAVILGALYIKERIEAQTDQLDAAFIAQDTPDRKRVIVNKRPKVTFEAREQKFETPVKRGPIENPNLPRGPGTLTLPESDTTDVPIGPEMNQGPKVSPIDRPINPIKPIAPTTVTPQNFRPTQQNNPLVDLDNSPSKSEDSGLGVPEITIREAKTEPRVKYIVKPTYPKNAKRAEKEGTVYLKATITIEGTAKDITAETDIGFGFVEAAIAALKRYKFEPATEDGKPIESTIRIPFEFKLEDD